MPPTATDQQLAPEIHDLRKDFHDFRVEIAEKLGAINANLEGFRGRTESGLAVARFVATAVVPIVIGLVAWGFTHAQRAPHLEDSLATIGKAVERQDEQIARLIELHRGGGGHQPPPSSPVPSGGVQKTPE